MAVRVQTSAALVFGIMASSRTATHARFQKSGAAPVVRQLTASVTAAAGERLRIPTGDLDIVYPVGQTTNTHMRALIDPYWDSETFQIDLMTSATAVISDTGYSQQTHSGWAISEEND